MFKFSTTDGRSTMAARDPYTIDLRCAVKGRLTGNPHEERLVPFCQLTFLTRKRHLLLIGCNLGVLPT